MKHMSDEELQRLIEEGMGSRKNDVSDKANPDFQAYGHLFNALETDPDFALSADFADKIVQNISWRQSIRVFLNQFLLVAACVLGGIGIGLGAIYYVNTDLGAQFQHMMNEAKWILFFGAVLLIIIQFVDKVFIRRPNRVSSSFS